MSRIDQLLASYRSRVALPLQPGLPLSQRVWFVVYPPDDERRLEPRLQEFELATQDARLGWRTVDLAGSFAGWMDTFDESERAACLGDPELVETYADPGFVDFLKERMEDAVSGLEQARAERTVIALTGLMELYDFIHVSSLIDALEDIFPGILLVFFPGEREGNSYRFLGARDGWDYLALPILPES